MSVEMNVTASSNEGVAAAGGGGGVSAGTVQTAINAAVALKANKVTGAANDDVALLDANGDLKGSGVKLADKVDVTAFVTDLAVVAAAAATADGKAVTADGKAVAAQNTANAKADKVAGAVNGNIPTLDAVGNGTDSGKRFGYNGGPDTIPNSAQVDAAIVQGLTNVPSLPSVAVVATAHIASKSGLSAQNGYTLLANDIILLPVQTDGTNGAWRANAGAWVRQKFTGSAWADVTTEMTYDQLGIANGIVNALNGTTSRNIQYQISIANRTAAFGATTVTVTTTTKLPARDLFNSFVSVSIGNDVTNNGSAAFPYGTIAKALTGASFPCALTLATSGAAMPESVTYTSGQSNLMLQVSDQGKKGGRLNLTGVHTLATGNTRVTFKGMTFTRASDAPIVIQSGNAGRHEFENITITTGGTVLIDISAGMTGNLVFRNVTATGSPLATIPLPAFTSAVPIEIHEQVSRLPFSGTGAASTTVVIYPTCPDGAVRVAANFVGTINWAGAAFGLPITEVITTQARLTAVLADTSGTPANGITTPTGIDVVPRYYLINFANPTSFETGAIFGKQSGGGVTEHFWARKYDQAPASVYCKADGKTYNNSGSGTWTQAGTTIAPGSIGSTELANTTVTPGTYGDATKAVSLTVDQDGRVTQVSESLITGTGTAGALQSATGTTTLKQGAYVSISNASMGTEILDVNIPAAGKWRVDARIHFFGTSQPYFVFFLATGGAMVADSIHYGTYSPNISLIEETYTGYWLIETTGPQSFTINARGAGDVRNNADGPTTASYMQVSGQSALVTGVLATAQHTLATRPTAVGSRGENTTLRVVEELTSSGWRAATDLPVAGLITTKNASIDGLYINNAGASIGSLNVGAATYFDSATNTYTDNVYLSANLPPSITVGGVVYNKSGVTYIRANPAAVGFNVRAQTFSPSVTTGDTTVLYDAVDVDTDNWYDPQTGEYCPKIAGHYSFAWSVIYENPGANNLEIYAALWKNGAQHTWGSNHDTAPNHYGASVGSAHMVYMNGTTDRVSVRLAHYVATKINPGTTKFPMRFSGHLVR